MLAITFSTNGAVSMVPQAQWVTISSMPRHSGVRVGHSESMALP